MRAPNYDIVIPLYNRAHVVADAVASALAQEHAPSNVVVVDDGSTDEGLAAIRHVCESDHRVVGLRRPNGGASAARNAGFEHVRSPWVAFLDSDDAWLPGAAERLLSASRDADVVVGSFLRVDELGRRGRAERGWDGAPECGWDGSPILDALETGGVVGPSWSIMRADLVRRIRGFDPSYRNCNDWDFFARMALAGARFARVPDTVALYRTVSGGRLVDDASSLEAGALRVRATLARGRARTAA